jgi:hypothetical protein
MGSQQFSREPILILSPADQPVIESNSRGAIHS